jgi:hypothetical protein
MSCWSLIGADVVSAVAAESSSNGFLNGFLAKDALDREITGDAIGEGKKTGWFVANGGGVKPPRA